MRRGLHCSKSRHVTVTHLHFASYLQVSVLPPSPGGSTSIRIALGRLETQMRAITTRFAAFSTTGETRYTVPSCLCAPILQLWRRAAGCEWRCAARPLPACRRPCQPVRAETALQVQVGARKREGLWRRAARRPEPCLGCHR